MTHLPYLTPEEIDYLDAVHPDFATNYRRAEAIAEAAVRIIEREAEIGRQILVRWKPEVWENAARAKAQEGDRAVRMARRWENPPRPK